MADPVVGELRPGRDFGAVCEQAGGIGTPVTAPVQTVDEKNGQFTAGCGHWFNSWLLRQAAVAGVASALISCPLCGYIQRIVTPASDLDELEIIIG